ncbi:class I SAM-dependent RNA methyltransferase [Bifidobacterium cuniculi]|uniref:class I SAM-dependent RNA methyltransferase n=1 Tax=Bifidobacterium cuniculi TaxID=1688 RepID=UPI000529B310|nr:RsmD family RNA methyltransferase [Bifidobacterium cuniculi]
MATSATVRIERFADQGRCVAHLDGRVVFVRFALPGELVEMALDQPQRADARFWTAEVTKVLEPSPLRVEPAWPQAGPLAWGGGLGGADLVHVSLEGQHEWKRAVVEDQMRRLGHVETDVEVVAMPGDAALDGMHWRTRIEMVTDERGHASMRRRESHVRVPIDTMPLATQALLAVADTHGVWDGLAPDGHHIRVAAPQPRTEDGGTGHDALLEAVGDNYGILVDGACVAGNERLTERTMVDGHAFDYRVEASGFWQMHREAPLALPQYVLDQVRGLLQGKDGAIAWDLYSGSGLFTLPLATLAVARMLSVEGAPDAVRNARHNLKAAGLHGVNAVQGDVAKSLAHVPDALAHPDVVVLDPPRAGAKAKVCRQIAASGARAVVYVACDPTSLARDTATLAAEGYELRAIRAFDIYPMTHHVETVATFTRA